MVTEEPEIKDSLQVETVLVEVDKPEPELEEISMQKVVHTVKKGDTYYGISKQYGNSVLDLLEWNELEIHDKLSIGQKLEVYVKEKPSSQPEGKDHILHTVQAGETLFSISRTYGVSVPELLKWNEKADSSLKVGEKIKIISMD